jgi:uncharacterized protein involved in oxidation of intracellular sulfur
VAGNAVDAQERGGTIEAMNVLIILNAAPYGTESSYNGLRLARTLQREHGAGIRLFLLADAVGCALPGQTTPDGYYNIERMLAALIRNGAQVKACGTCLQARGMADLSLIDGVEPATMKDLAAWTIECERSVTF